ncbi:Four helix bundle protein [Gammaproteobacteria bacterium]
MRRDHGPRHQSLPIWRDANRLLLEIERSVCKFPRYHKYTLGSDLRRLVMEVCRCVVRAAHFVAGSEAQHADHERALERLVLLVEDLKITIQLAKELEAFASFAEFARVAELAVAVGKQSGGWRKAAWAKARPEVQSPVPGARG